MVMFLCSLNSLSPLTALHLQLDPLTYIHVSLQVFKLKTMKKENRQLPIITKWTGRNWETEGGEWMDEGRINQVTL